MQTAPKAPFAATLSLIAGVIFGATKRVLKRVGTDAVIGLADEVFAARDSRKVETVPSASPRLTREDLQRLDICLVVRPFTIAA